MTEPETTDEGPSDEDDASGLLGQTLSDRYRIDAVLGTGGMGAVYQAEHLLMHKRVAIKVLHPEMTRMPEVVARFEREAMAAAHIEHPNVAAATDFGKLADGSFFLVLEFVEGKSLRDEIEKGPLSPERAVHITRQVLMALTRAHGLGIVHRDLKPENVMLVERDGDPDFVKVLDFGIAKVNVGDLGKSTSGPKKSTAALTQAGLVYGTPEYMAPEQALAQDIDHRADLYALGVMLFEMLTGRRPFEADNPVQILGMVVSMPVPAMSKTAPGVVVPEAVEQFARTLLEKLAKDRYADARAALDVLDAATGYVGPASRRGSMASLTGPLSIQGVGAVPVGAGLLPGSAGQRASAQPELVFGLPRNIAALAAAGVAVIVVLVVVLIVALGRGDKKQAGLVSSASATPTGSAPVAASDLGDDQIKAAAGEGIGALEALRDKHPRDPRLHRALAKAQLDAKNGGAAVAAIVALVEAEPTAAEDKTVREQLFAAAQLDNGTDAAFAAFDKVGDLGPDVLYDLATAPKVPPKIVRRANDAVATPDVLARASKALKVALELRAARRMAGGEQCRVRKALFVRAKDEADARALPYLTELTAMKGCGFLKRSDCHPCLRGDSSLSDAIVAIRGREK